MLTPEEINYIVAWHESGNEWREDEWDMPSRVSSLIFGSTDLYQLNPAGLTIAKQAIENRKLREALEQACEVAEEFVAVLAGEFGYKELTPLEFEAIGTMRATRKELLK